MSSLTIVTSLAPPPARVLDSLPRQTGPLAASAGDVRQSSPGELATALRSACPVRVKDQAQLADALMKGRSVVASAELVRQALNPYLDGSLVAKVTSSDRSTFVGVGNVSLGGTLCSTANAVVVITPGANGALQLTPTSLLAKHGHWSSSYLLVSGGSGSGNAMRSHQEMRTLQALLDARAFPSPFASK